ncbi:MAG: TolC family protein [Gemmatimonadota bacterium]|jgi:outer membrane protein TolC
MIERRARAGLRPALLAAVAAACALAPSTARSQEVRLEELLAIAEAQSPALQAALLGVEATRARESEAGLLPDPTVGVGVSGLALPEFSASMPASMAPSFQASQRFPLAGKRSLRDQLAKQTTQIGRAEAEEIWWSIRTEIAMSFYDLFRVDRQIDVLRETTRLLEDFEIVALSKYSAGAEPQADVLRAGVAVARTEADIQHLLARRRVLVSRLNGLLNRTPDTPIPTPELSPLPGGVPSPDTLNAWAAESRPGLRAARMTLARADTRLELAEKAIWPDLTLGVQYGLGRMDGDPKSMGGVSLGFSLPIHAGSRQRGEAEEATALQGVARARLDEALATVGSEVNMALAELDGGRSLLRLYQQDILPQARAAVESSLAAYRAGTLDFMALVDAQTTVNRFEAEYYDQLAFYGSAVARLEMTVGRSLPVGVSTITEVR